MVRNVLEYLEASAARFPDKIALRDENEELTYSEYVSQAKTVASWLAAGVTKDQRNQPVAVIIDRKERMMSKR